MHVQKLPTFLYRKKVSQKQSHETPRSKYTLLLTGFDQRESLTARIESYTMLRMRELLAHLQHRIPDACATSCKNHQAQTFDLQKECIRIDLVSASYF